MKYIFALILKYNPIINDHRVIINKKINKYQSRCRNHYKAHHNLSISMGVWSSQWLGVLKKSQYKMPV